MVSKKDVEWLKRDKYGSPSEEVGSRVTRSNFARDLTRLQAGEPLDYVVGWKEFLGCKIDLSLKPLIPREETEFWVGEVLRGWTSMSPKSNLAKPNEATCEVAFSSTKNDFSPLPPTNHLPEAGVRSRFSSEPEMRLRTPLRVLDLFSGSGCIGLAILKHVPNAHVTFAEKDPKLCSQIKKNLRLNGLKGRVIQSDLFKPCLPDRQAYFSISNLETLQKSGKLSRFDVIFANPPYVPTKQKVQKSVKDWEPKEALYAGPDGLVIIKKFLKQAKDHLSSGGRIYMEFGYGQKAKIEKLLKPARPGSKGVSGGQFDYAHCRFYRDQFGKYRWVMIYGQIERK